MKAEFPIPPDRIGAMGSGPAGVLRRSDSPTDRRKEEGTVALFEESSSPYGEEGLLDADGFVVLVADPVTGDCDCYGPYRNATEAHRQAEWRRLEFDIGDLADVVVGVVPWHADGARLSDTDA